MNPIARGRSWGSGSSRRRRDGADVGDFAARLVRVGLALALVVALVSGCRSRPPVTGAEGAEGGEASDAVGKAEKGAAIAAHPSIEAAALALLPVDAWAGRWLLRQRVRVEWPSGGESFDAVLQRRPGELALIGLGPMNLVGFRLALVASGAASAGEGGSRIEFENRSGRALPFAPAHILADVQRVFYPWLPPADPAPAPGAGAASNSDPDPGPDPAPGGEVVSDCPEDCERSGRNAAVAVWERRSAGRLVERRFAIADRLDAGEVRVRYADWQGEPAFPRRVELENGWFGYRLTIETLEATPLPSPRGSSPEPQP